MIFIYIVHLEEEEISNRVISNEKRFFFFFFFFLASYLNSAGLPNLTSEIVDRLFNAYQRDLPRKLDFVDEVELGSCR